MDVMTGYTFAVQDLFPMENRNLPSLPKASFQWEIGMVVGMRSRRYRRFRKPTLLVRDPQYRRWRRDFLSSGVILPTGMHADVNV